ncbi:MAG: ABC1 kinase family protein [Flavobacteriales bacterium]
MFKIFKIRSLLRQVFRAIYILYVLCGYFWVTWMGNNRLTIFLVPRIYKTEGTVRSKEERLCIVIVRLGPTFIKFGQILADRPDIVSSKFREQLKKLQSNVKPFDDDLAFTLIEQELGEPIEHKFQYINKTCIGSASIGQVYRGKLKTGEDVVIKIQRPNIKDKIKLDLQILEFMVKRVAREYPELVVMNVPAFVDEFAETLMNELNYFNEVANAVRFEDMFSKVEYCKIPKMFTSLCTNKLIVMEYIDGVAPDNREILFAKGLDPSEVAKNGVNIFLKMIFEHGFFHADPHAGNMFILPGNTLGLIDFGMTGSLKPSHMEFLASFTLGLANKNAEKLTDALLKVSGTQFFKDKEDLEFRLQEILNRYGSMNYDTINFSAVLQDCVKVIVRFELQIPSSIYLLIKALATLEKFGYALDPDITLAGHIRPFAIALIKKKYSPKTIAGNVFDVLKNYLHLIRTFPSELSEILNNVKQGKLIHDIRINDDQLFEGAFKQAGQKITLVLLTVGALIGSGLVLVWRPEWRLAEIVFTCSSILAGWIVLRLLIKTKL